MLRIRTHALAVVVLAAIALGAQNRFQAYTDGTSYNAGSKVRLKIAGPLSGKLTAAVRYAGDARPVADEIQLTGAGSGYEDFWTIPPDARTGRYDISITLQDAASKVEYPRVASFAVHRKLARVDRVEFDREFFVSGDPIACRISLRNDSARPLNGLRVEFSDAYFPWIAPGKYQKPVAPSFTAESVSLDAGAEKIISAPVAIVAEAVK